MSKDGKLLAITSKTIVFDIALVVIVWFLFTLWFRPHVPSYDPVTVFLVAGFTALPGAGTFYMCLQMFKVTRAHQKELKDKK